MLDISLWEQHVVFVDRLWQTLPHVQVKAGTRVALHHGIYTWSRELGRPQIFRLRRLGEDTKVHRSSIMVARILRDGPIQREF